MNFVVGVYIRLSKEDDRKIESESIINQRKIIREYIKKKDYKLHKEYIDDGYSGTNFDRPAFKEMMEDINNKIINTIITKDLSRLGRDYIETGRLLETYFPENNIRYISILDNIDTFDETINNDIVPFKALLNDMYAKDISRKVRISLNIKKRQGLFLGWKAAFGYKKNPKNKYKLVINKKESKVVKYIFSLALANNSISKIRSTLMENRIKSPSGKNTWCNRTIESILTNPTYIGNLTQGTRRKLNYKSKKQIRTKKEEWIIEENTHEKIIEEKVFNEIGKKIKKQKELEYIKKKYLLSNLIFCEECGHKISILKSNDKKRLYTSCSYYRKNSKQKLCTPHTINYTKLEKKIVSNYDINNIKKIFINKNKRLKIYYHNEPITLTSTDDIFPS